MTFMVTNVFPTKSAGFWHRRTAEQFGTVTHRNLNFSTTVVSARHPGFEVVFRNSEKHGVQCGVVKPLRRRGSLEPMKIEVHASGRWFVSGEDPRLRHSELPKLVAVIKAVQAALAKPAR